MTKLGSYPMWVVLILSLALFGVGCGGDDDDTGGVAPTATVPLEETPPPQPTSTAPPSPTPTVPQVANICDEFEFIEDGMQVDLCAPTQELSPDMPQDVCNPIGAGWVPSQGSFDHVAWQTFVALNWPANLSLGRGEPDKSKSIGATDAEGNLLPTVWETYKQVYEVFQYDDPSWMLTVDDWNDQQELPPECPQVPGTKVLQHTSKARPETTVDDLDDEVNEAFHGPLVDQAGNLVRYEIRLNRTEFDQIVVGNYYQVGADTTGLVFIASGSDPTGEGAIEVKAAWKVLSDAEYDSGRFYAREIYVYNDAIGSTPASCTAVNMGLVGLHIIRKTDDAPDWFWGTWEHIDNIPDPSATPQPNQTYSFFDADCTPVVTTTECAAAAKSTNPSDPAYQCCPNLQRYNPIGPMGDPYDLERGPIQVTRLEPLTGANDCNAAYKTALAGTVWENYFMVSTQWTMSQDGPPFMKTIIPTYLRNSVLETYMVGFSTATPPVQENQSSCIGCHQYGVDNSYIFQAAMNAAPLPTPTP